MQTYMLDKNNAKTVHMWMQQHHDRVFFYHNNIVVDREVIGSTMPFTIGIQNKWQRKMMLMHGHNWAISMDATFGVNEKKVCPSV